MQHFSTFKLRYGVHFAITFPDMKRCTKDKHWQLKPSSAIPLDSIYLLPRKYKERPSERFAQISLWCFRIPSTCVPVYLSRGVRKLPNGFLGGFRCGKNFKQFQHCFSFGKDAHGPHLLGGGRLVGIRAQLRGVINFPHKFPPRNDCGAQKFPVSKSFGRIMKSHFA